MSSPHFFTFKGLNFLFINLSLFRSAKQWQLIFFFTKISQEQQTLNLTDAKIVDSSFEQGSVRSRSTKAWNKWLVRVAYQMHLDAYAVASQLSGTSHPFALLHHFDLCFLDRQEYLHPRNTILRKEEHGCHYNWTAECFLQFHHSSSAFEVTSRIHGVHLTVHCVCSSGSLNTKLLHFISVDVFSSPC